MKKMFNEGNQIKNFLSSYGSYGSGSGSTTLVQGVGSRDQCELQREEAGLPALHQPPAGRVCRAQEVHRQCVRQLSS
jgi:hypothetical protein